MKKITILLSVLLVSNILLSQDLMIDAQYTYSTQNCPEQCSTTIDINATGGTEPYSYFIEHDTYNLGLIDGSTSTFSGLCPGNYTLTVKDFNGNTATTDLAFSEPLYLRQPFINFTSKSSIEVIGDGGTPTYTYSLDGGPFTTTNTFSDLDLGSYTISVRDANDCETSATVTIAPPLDILLNLTDTFCFNNCDAYAFVEVTGGLPPYRYSYSASNGQIYDYIDSSDTSVTFSGLCTELYDFFVEDANGFTVTIFGEISQPEEISSSAIINLPTGNVASGVVEIDAIGGVSPYSYSIDGSDFQTQNIFTNLSSGTHDLIVQDVLGCFKNFAVNTGTINVDNTVVVNGFTLTATLDADSYQWINADTNTIIPGATNKVYVATAPGNYRVEMTIDDLTSKRTSKVSVSKAIITFSSPVYQVTGNLSLSDNELGKLQLYPNPTKDVLNLPETTINENYTIYTILGKKVNSGIITNKELSVENLLNGLYFLNITNHNTAKFIKK